jgi:hypothetical protein
LFQQPAKTTTTTTTTTTMDCDFLYRRARLLLLFLTFANRKNCLQRAQADRPDVAMCIS